MEYSRKVAISAADEYNTAKIKEILSSHFAALGINTADMRGKRVVIKPNLVMKSRPKQRLPLTPP